MDTKRLNRAVQLALPSVAFAAVFPFFTNYLFGFSSRTWLVTLAFTAIFLVAGWALGWLTSKGGPLLWMEISIGVLAGLLVPTSILVDGGWDGFDTDPLGAGVLFLLPLAAILLAAYLLYAGLRLRHHPGLGQAALICLALALALVTMVARSYYHLLLWDRTTDSLDFLWLLPAAAAAILAGLDVFLFSKGWDRAGGVGFAAVVVLALFFGYTQTRQVDFRAFTTGQAARVETALDSFYADHGRYPAALAELSPRYAFPLPYPLVINGMDWCYNAGDDFYRLGYVTRDHWSSPIFYAKGAASRGVIPDGLAPLCQEQIDQLERAMGTLRR